MLNNFCFHVYAQKSLSHSHTLSLSHYLTLTLSLFHSLIHSLSTCWTTFVFMSMLKSRCLLPKIAMFFWDFHIITITLSCEFRGHRAGSQLKMVGRLPATAVHSITTMSEIRRYIDLLITLITDQASCTWDNHNKSLAFFSAMNDRQKIKHGDYLNSC